MLIAIKGFDEFPYRSLSVVSLGPTYLAAPIDFLFTVLFLKPLLRQLDNNKIILSDLDHVTFLGAASSSDTHSQDLISITVFIYVWLFFFFNEDGY